MGDEERTFKGDRVSTDSHNYLQQTRRHRRERLLRERDGGLLQDLAVGSLQILPQELMQEGGELRVQAQRRSDQDQVQDKTLQELPIEQLLQVQRSVQLRTRG